MKKLTAIKMGKFIKEFQELTKKYDVEVSFDSMNFYISEGYAHNCWLISNLKEQQIKHSPLSKALDEDENE